MNYMQILSCWHKLEHFSPAILPKDKSLKPLKELPWMRPLEAKDPKKTIQYTIYLGVFSQISVSDFVKDFFKDERNNPNVTDAKVCYASLKLDNLGVYIQNTFGFSTMPWALRQLEAGKANTNSWSEDFDKLRKNLLERLGENRKVLTDAIVESRSGMNKPGQPIGSFFLLGPTGTGKTELAKALAEALFNDEKAMIRFDMSEFKEEHSAALLLGAPPGYVGYEEGGVLVNRIRRQPYAVVLFDEIEKAHSSVYDIFLQIMDEGKLHDRLGKEGDFSNSIVLFTSNVGSEWLSKQINEGKNPSTTDLMEVMGSYFRPEFLARLSEIVPFSPINETMLVRIFEIQLKGVIALLEKQHIDIEITEKAKNLLATRGFTPKYGARQVAGTIRNYIRRPISKMIVAGTLAAGNTVVVDVADNGDIDWNVK